MGKKVDFFNREVGGFGLGLVILSAYVGFKLSLLGISMGLDVLTNPQFIWYTIWFTGIVFSALATDLFVNNKSWVENAQENLMRIDLKADERVAIIKQQLEIAVDRYQSVFILVNGFDKTWKRVWANVSKIYKGHITVKELLIIVVYALWDLVIRNGLTNLENPFDIVVLFLGLTVLKVVDANSGFAGLVAEMYKELDEDKSPEIMLTLWANYIKQLVNMYDLGYTEDESPEIRFEEALKIVKEVKPKLSNETISTITAKVSTT
jgi:hypothetical protein